MAWLRIVALILQYGPALFEALAAMLAAIRAKNVEAGKAAVSRASQIALDIVASLKARSDLTDAQKRERAWHDIQIGSKMIGVELSESESRSLAELSYQKLKEGLS